MDTSYTQPHKAHNMRQLLIALFFSFTLATFSSSYAAKTGEIGIISAANPGLKKQTNTGETKDVKIGDPIFFGETIITDKSGNAQVTFKDKSALTVAASSSITIDEFVYDPATQDGNIGASITKGTFRFIGGALSKKKPAKFKTPVATIGIHGSSFMFSFNESGSDLTINGQSGLLEVVAQSGDKFHAFGENSVSTRGGSITRLPVDTVANTIKTTITNLSSDVGESGGVSFLDQPSTGQVRSAVSVMSTTESGGALGGGGYNVAPLGCP
jgi:hypothetical protein